MKKVCILYPIGNIINPITGGELYDSMIFKQITNTNDIMCTYITQNDCAKINKWLIPLFLIFKNKKIFNNDTIMLNSAWFPQSIFLLFFLRIFYAHIQIFIIHHHFRYQETKGLKKYIFFLLEKTSLQLSTSIITPNPYTKKIINDILPKKNVIFLEMAFDKSQHNLSTFKPKRLLFVGSVYKRKGLTYLLESLGLMTKEELNGLHLDIIGNQSSPTYYEELKALITKYKLDTTVRFVGYVSSEQLSKYYSNAYCFVFPSLLEGYGMVLIEAMSYGLPVIAFDNSAMPYTIKTNFNGILVKNKNIHELKDAILKLCNEEQYHHLLCKGALQTYQNSRSIIDLSIDIDNFIKSYLLRT